MSWGPRARLNYRYKKMMGREMMREARRRERERKGASGPQRPSSHHSAPKPSTPPVFDPLSRDRAYAVGARNIFFGTFGFWVFVALLPNAQLLATWLFLLLIPEAVVWVIYQAQFNAEARLQPERDREQEKAIRQNRHASDLARAHLALQLFRTPENIPLVYAPTGIFIGERCFFVCPGSIRRPGMVAPVQGQIYVTDQMIAFVAHKNPLGMRLAHIKAIRQDGDYNIRLEHRDGKPSQVFTTEQPLETMAFLVGALFLCGHKPAVDSSLLQGLMVAA